ncbi:MAG: type II secretion system F family protein [Patescibacteria group bacterium]
MQLSPQLQSLWNLLNPVPRAQKLFFTEHLRVMIGAGLSLSETLQALEQQAEHRRFRSIIGELRKSVERGETFSQALAKFPDVFSAIFVNMVSVGEVAGTLERNLTELATQMKKDYTLRSRVRGALIYPAIIFSATILISVGMIIFVIPKILSIFKEFTVELPLSTRILIAATDAIQKYGVLIAIAFLLIVLSLVYLGRTKKGKIIVHAAILRLPIFGSLAARFNLALLARTLGTLLGTDVPIVRSCEITADVLGNVNYRMALRDAAERIKKGIGLAEVFAESPKLFPPVVTQMVRIGERSGTLDRLLSEIAGFYEDQIDDAVKNLSSIIEPVLILFLGAMVGLIAFAVISPIYALSQSI